MCHLYDIETVLKSLKKIGKNIYIHIFMTILELAEKFKTMNQPGLAGP